MKDLDDITKKLSCIKSSSKHELIDMIVNYIFKRYHTDLIDYYDSRKFKKAIRYHEREHYYYIDTNSEEYILWSEGYCRYCNKSNRSNSELLEELESNVSKYVIKQYGSVNYVKQYEILSRLSKILKEVKNTDDYESNGYYLLRLFEYYNRRKKLDDITIDKDVTMYVNLLQNDSISSKEFWQRFLNTPLDDEQVKYLEDNWKEINNKGIHDFYETKNFYSNLIGTIKNSLVHTSSVGF